MSIWNGNSCNNFFNVQAIGKVLCWSGEADHTCLRMPRGNTVMRLENILIITIDEPKG